MKHSVHLSLIIILVAILFLALQWSTPTVVVVSGLTAQDSLSDYSYMKTHYINGSLDGALSDYQIRFVVHKGTGTDRGENVYLNGHSLNWPNDIRFTDNNDNLLSFWIESNDDNTASIWVKVPFISSSPDKTELKLFYGNPSVGSGSNGSATWVFFDDFNTLDGSKWRTLEGSPSVTDGILTLQSNSTNNSHISTIDDVSSDYTRILVRLKTAHWSNTSYNEVFSAASSYKRSLEADFSNNPEYAKSHTYVNWIDGEPLGYYVINGWSAGTWHILNAKRLNDRVQWSVDYTHPVDCSETYWTEPGRIEVYALHDGAEISMDWVCIGLVTKNEPVHENWGSEQRCGASICPGILGLAILPLLLFIITRFRER